MFTPGSLKVNRYPTSLSGFMEAGLDRIPYHQIGQTAIVPPQENALEECLRCITGRVELRIPAALKLSPAVGRSEADSFLRPYQVQTIVVRSAKDFFDAACYFIAEKGQALIVRVRSTQPLQINHHYTVITSVKDFYYKQLDFYSSGNAVRIDRNVLEQKISCDPTTCNVLYSKCHSFRMAPGQTSNPVGSRIVRTF